MDSEQLPDQSSSIIMGVENGSREDAVDHVGVGLTMARHAETTDELPVNEG